MEKRLISKIHVFLTVIILPVGQFGEKVLAVDFPVDIQNNIGILPHKFGTCSVMTVSYEENTDIKPTHLVRKKKMYLVLIG